MVDNKKFSNAEDLGTDGAETDGVDLGRRDALKNLGALAGAAPAVAVLLSPSASRANGGGSPEEAPFYDYGPRKPGHSRGPGPQRNPGSGAPTGNSGMLGREN